MPSNYDTTHPEWFEFKLTPFYKPNHASFLVFGLGWVWDPLGVSKRSMCLAQPFFLILFKPLGKHDLCLGPPGWEFKKKPDAKTPPPLFTD